MLLEKKYMCNKNET